MNENTLSYGLVQTIKAGRVRFRHVGVASSTAHQRQTDHKYKTVPNTTYKRGHNEQTLFFPFFRVHTNPASVLRLQHHHLLTVLTMYAESTPPPRPASTRKPITLLPCDWTGSGSIRAVGPIREREAPNAVISPPVEASLDCSKTRDIHRTEEK